MPELPYFGKYMCECGVRSATDLHFKIHSLKHLADDVGQLCSNLMSKTKQEDEVRQGQIEEFQNRLFNVKNSLLSMNDDKVEVSLSKCKYCGIESEFSEEKQQWQGCGHTI